MRIQQMPPDQARGFQDWISREWSRCSDLRGTFENHAITYLATANGGGAAAVVAFSGSAGFAIQSVYVALGLFLAGLIFTGFGIASGLRRMSWITRELGAAHREFNKGKLDSVELEEAHHSRFGKRTYGNVLGWAAFFCFIVGTGCSAYAYSAFLDTKTVKPTQNEHPVSEVRQAPAETRPLVVPSASK
jgi:hypothetical protein